MKQLGITQLVNFFTVSTSEIELFNLFAGNHRLFNIAFISKSTAITKLFLINCFKTTIIDR